MATERLTKRRRISIDDSMIYFIPYKLKTPISTWGTFSTVSIILKNVKRDDFKVRYKPSSIFNLSEEGTEEFERIPFETYDTLSTTGSSGKNVSEKEVLLYTTEHFLHLLTNTIVFNKDYKTSLEKKKMLKSCSITTGFLGLGTRHTWHGEPDARVTGKSVINSCTDIIALPSLTHMSLEEPLQKPGETDLVDSDGDSTVIEAKKRINKKSHISQLISTTIVASFTENNRHPDLNPAIPCILINATTAYIAIYDCNLDVLLCSTAIDFQVSDGRIDADKALLLWMTINHRKFMKSLRELKEKYACGYSSFLEQCQCLKFYKEMREKHLDWRGARHDSSDDFEDDGAYITL